MVRVTLVRSDPQVTTKNVIENLTTENKDIDEEPLIKNQKLRTNN